MVIKYGTHRSSTKVLGRNFDIILLERNTEFGSALRRCMAAAARLNPARKVRPGLVAISGRRTWSGG